MTVLVVLAVAGFLVWAARAKFAEMRAKHGMHNLIFRALTMRPLGGPHLNKTDATFFRQSADRATGKSGGRHHRAGVHNLAISLGVLTGLVVVVYGLSQALMLTLTLACTAVVLPLAVAVVVKVRALRRTWRDRRVIGPLAVAAETLIDPDRSLDTHRGSHIRMEPGWLKATTGLLGTMTLPDAFHASEAQRAAVENLVTARLPVPVRFTWHTTAMPQQVRFLAAPPMPAMVRFRDHLGAVAANRPGEYVLGMRADGSLMRVTLKQESAHHLFSMNTGTGKSSLLQMAVAQLLATDSQARAVVVDVKQVSLAPLRGIPGVELYDQPSDIAAMAEAIAGVREEMEHRYNLLRTDPLADFAPLLLVLEEGNSFAVQLKAWHDQTRTRSNSRATPPLWARDFAPLLWRGRAVGVHVLAVFQLAQDRFMGGLSLRQSFGTVSLAGFKPSMYRAIAGGGPVPPCQKGRGRVLTCDGESETWVQVLYDEPEFIADWLRDKRASLNSPGGSGKFETGSGGIRNGPGGIRNGSDGGPLAAAGLPEFAHSAAGEVNS